MKMMIGIIGILLLTVIKSDSVCDEKLLKMELMQDIEDNGMLDCLRVVEAPHSYQETEEEKNKRIASQWDSDCAFEADYDWMKPLRDIHQIQNLVDVSGEIVESDFENQADMCEIVRAAIASGKMQKVTSDVQGIPVSILDEIDCYGSDKQTEICAVNNESFFKKGSWTILLEALSLSINKKQRWTKLEGDAANKSGGEEESEEDKNMQDKIDKAKEKDGEGEEEGDEEERVLMVYQGNDSKYKTERPPCVDVRTEAKMTLIKGVGIQADKLKKLNVLVLANIVGSMKSIKDKKKLGGLLQGVLTIKGKDNKDSIFEIGRDQSFAIQTAFMHTIKGKEDLKIELKLQGDATLSCDLDGDNNSVMAIGIDGENLKVDSKKVEKDFMYPIKEDKKKGGKGKKEGKKEGEKGQEGGDQIQTGLVEALGVKKTAEEEGGHVLVYYQIASGIDATVMTCIMLNEEEVRISRMVNSQTDNKGLSVMNSGMGIMKLKEGENKFDLQFQIQPTGKEMKQVGSPYGHAQLHVMDLPKEIKVEEKTTSEDLSLSAKEWTTIDDLDIEFKNEKPRTVLVIYNIIGQLEEKGQVIQTRITLNDKEVIMGRSRSNDYDITKDKQTIIPGSYIAARGQAIISLDKKSASNKVSLDYKVNKGSLMIEKDHPQETANMQIFIAIPNKLKEDKK